jgi:hypothetical protein
MTTERRRHGCLTAWLIFMLVANSLLAVALVLTGVLSNTLNEAAAQQGTPVLPGWAIFVSIGILLFNIVCAIALLNWKKWGFYGFLGSTVASFVINLALGVPIAQSIGGFIGVAILYGLLNLGEEKAWPRLD